MVGVRGWWHGQGVGAAVLTEHMPGKKGGVVELGASTGKTGYREK